MSRRKYPVSDHSKGQRGQKAASLAWERHLSACQLDGEGALRAGYRGLDRWALQTQGVRTQGWAMQGCEETPRDITCPRGPVQEEGTEALRREFSWPAPSLPKAPGC